MSYHCNTGIHYDTLLTIDRSPELIYRDYILSVVYIYGTLHTIKTTIFIFVIDEAPGDRYLGNRSQSKQRVQFQKGYVPSWQKINPKECLGEKLATGKQEYRGRGSGPREYPHPIDENQTKDVSVREI